MHELQIPLVQYSTTVARKHHFHSQEAPLPLYIAMKIHGATYKRNLIDTLFNFGICDSYNRLPQLTSNTANGICQHFTMDGVVCPPKMRNGLFTTAAVDNIDYNPSSAPTKDSFHYRARDVKFVWLDTVIAALKKQGYSMLNQLVVHR